jgi:hypothetical protein
MSEAIILAIIIWGILAYIFFDISLESLFNICINILLWFIVFHFVFKYW